MGQQLLEVRKESNCIYLAPVGGGALYIQQVKGVKGIFWDDLGLDKVLAFEVEGYGPLEVEGYGPLLVAMDNKGNSLYEMVQEEVNPEITLRL